MRHFLEKNTHFFFHSVLLAFAILSGLGIVLGAGLFSLTKGLLSIGIIVFLTLLVVFPIRGRLIGGILCLMSLLLTIVLIEPAYLLPFLREYYVWMFGTSTENLLWLQIYELFQVCWISIIAFCCQRLAERFVYARYTTAGVGLMWVLWDMLTKQELPHLCVVCSLTYVLITYVFWTESHWTKKRIRTGRSYLLWLLPYMLIFMLLLGVTPTPQKPYDWALFKGAYESLREAFLTFTHSWNMGNQEDFDNAGIGFSEEGALSGELMDENQEVMEIQVSSSLKTNIYLNGKIYDTFWGTNWTQENTAVTNDRIMDALETVYAVRRFDKEYSYDYLHPTILNMRYKLFHTGYLFAPLKTWSITGAKTAYTMEGANLILKKRASYGVSYATQYLQINLQNPLFSELLNAPLLDDETIWADVQRKYNKIGKRYTLNDLKEHRKSIYDIYGIAPILSPEIELYLEEITKDAVTDLDKLSAIEAALSELTYTRNPGSLPASIDSESDFLDYFLLESKQGYCSYFATAFVLLARAEGIPARYVEGFCVPVKNETFITVYARMAHAWPEVYIDEVGWIPFEPTPGYNKIRYTPWSNKLQKPATPTYTPTPATTPTTATPAPTRTPAPMITPNTTETPKASTFSLSKPAAVHFIITLGLLFIILLPVTERYLRKRRYKNSTPAQKLHLQIQRNIQILAMLGYKRAPNETLQEFRNRVQTKLRDIYIQKKADTSMSDSLSKNYLPNLYFLELYENVLYSNCPVTEDMLCFVQKEWKELLELLKKQNKFLYILINLQKN